MLKLQHTLFTSVNILKGERFIMEYKRSIPRKAWACYFDGDENAKLRELEKRFPMVQFILVESKKMIICNTGERLLDIKVEKAVLEMGGAKA